MDMGYHVLVLLMLLYACTPGQSVNSTSSSVYPSLTYVVDTSGSMSLSELRAITKNLLSAPSNNVTRQYTLMEFNDPNVGPLRTTFSSIEFITYINYLSTSGGGDCPEYALTGLLRALENSPSGSLVVLATDASAKDSNDSYTINRIFSLIDSKQFMVFILGAKPCGSTYNYDFQVYRDIASRSYGHVLQNSSIGENNSSEVSNLFNFFLQIPLNSTTKLLSLNTENYYNYTYFYVSSNLTSLIVSITCSGCSLYLYKPTGSLADRKSILSGSWGSLFYVEYPSSGYWSIEVYSSNYYSLRVLGSKGNYTSNGNTSSICSSCDINASCRKDLFSYTCVCNDGFSGNGHYCYDINECDYYYYYYNPCNNGYCVNTYGSYNCSCYYGFEYKNNTCVDVDECSNPALNSCHSLATCSNYYGSYSCACPYGYYGNGYYCEVDECTRDVCGFARECIKTTGSHYCVDPCYNYTTLNEPSRSTEYYDYYYYYYYYYGRSDYYLRGWYRFEGSGGTHLPEFCPSIGRCYTRSPMWLNGTHPVPTDGIVNATACAKNDYNCCSWTSDILIKACPGDYYIYKFTVTRDYYAAYCTDPATVASSCSCAADEECKLVGGRYGCYCKSNGTVSALQALRPVLSCGNQEIKASFQKCQLQSFNLNYKNIHLRDKSCIGFSDFNMTNTITVVSILKNGVCGNELVNNKTHVIYKNTIYISMDSSVGGEDILSIDYSCVYPLNIEISLETALKPFASSANYTLEGTGQLLATIALYQDSSYKIPYEGSDVLLTDKSVLYVGILLKSPDIAQLSVLMKNCYATASKNSSSSAKYYIIKESCPSQQDTTITVTENGKSQNGLFAVQLFGYVKNSNVVYLHCDVHFCDRSSETCTPSCTGARAFSSDTGVTDTTLSLGPIIKQANTEDLLTTKNPANNGGKVLMDHMTIWFLTGTMLMILFFQ